MVDTLHISNHKTPQCHVSYDPARVKEELPDANTMIAEQTFAWLSRYKVYMLYLNYTLNKKVICIYKHIYVHYDVVPLYLDC